MQLTFHLLFLEKKTLLEEILPGQRVCQILQKKKFKSFHPGNLHSTPTVY